ncbi:MAG: acyl-CoA dehydrogenase family protein, partial [Chloroflexi bacterium]|nr:acyl-CoA dehydrogenase family protein [Chloroflexota bacterium]
VGLMRGVYPEAYGGAAMEFVALAALIEELARVCSATALMAGWPSCSAGQGLWTYGREEQKRQFLAPFLAGERVGAVAMTEPHSGSDVARKLETRCARDGDAYVISGAKSWITNLQLCSWFITFATLDPRLGSRGICAFLVDRDTPGVSIHPFKNKVGARTWVSGEVIYDRVRVPAERLVGHEGEGYKVLLAGAEIGRLACAARCLGQIWACVEAATQYARERIVFEQPIGRYQLIQSKITDMVVAQEAARLLTYRLAWLKDQGFERCQREASIAKLFASDALMQIATDACQIHGAYSCSPEYAVGRYFRDAKFAQIYDGTSEIHRVMIAEHALGYRGAA